MMKYLLDTDTCIAYFRKKFSLKEKIDSIGLNSCFISEITLFELTFGAYNSERFNKHITEVLSLEEVIEVLPIRPVRNLYSKERKRLRDLGNRIPNFDLLIGCTAVHGGMVMVTGNSKHFSRIEGIELENWMDKAFNEFI